MQKAVLNYVLMFIFLCQHWVLAAQPMVLHSAHHAAVDCQPTPLLHGVRHSNSSDLNTSDPNSSDPNTFNSNTFNSTSASRQDSHGHGLSAAPTNVAVAIATELLDIVIDTAVINDAAIHDSAVKDAAVKLASADDHNHVNHMHGHADLPLESKLWSWPRQSHASQCRLPQFTGIHHTPPVPPPNLHPV